jgi:hypothetical protein
MNNIHDNYSLPTNVPTCPSIKVLYPYKTTEKSIVLYISVFNFYGKVKDLKGIVARFLKINLFLTHS